MDLYLGIDLGTSSVKLMLVDGNGQICSEIAKDYPVYYPRPGWSEQHASDWWQAICEALPELLRGYDGQAVKGIGVAGQMHGLVILDEDDQLIRPTILWNDGRTEQETAFLNEVIGKEKLFAYTGNIAFAGFTAPKILWLHRNEPESFAKIKKIMLPKDYINYLLTGVHCTDYSDAAGMLLLDVKHKRWSKEMLDICHITEEQMSTLFESFAVVGTLKAEIAERFGLNPKAIVVAGAGDNAAAAVGTGAVGESKCNVSLGTSGTIFVSSDRFCGDRTQAIHAFCHADGGYHLMGCILSAALCNKWFCDDILRTTDYHAEEMAASAEFPSQNQVFFLPYLMGERSPINDTNATGMFIGLHPNTSRSDMYLAILEGVAFAIKDNFEIIKQFGVDIKSSCLCGGGAKSVLWRKILANVLNIELTLPITEQGPGFGAALLAMVGVGRYKDVKDASESFFRIKDTVAPTPEISSFYAEKYEKYRMIYPMVKDLYQVLNK